MGTNLHQFAKKNGVKYFFVSFVDLFGVLRSKLVPATAIDEIQFKMASGNIDAGDICLYGIL